MNTYTQYELDYQHSLIGHLGIKFQPSEQGVVLASMSVDHRTAQPFGYLSGGASLALAESIAGHGSCLLCQEDQTPCGVQVSGNHFISVPLGETVIGKGKLIHSGRNIHVWNIDIFNKDIVVSTARVVNYLILKDKKS